MYFINEFLTAIKFTGMIFILKICSTLFTCFSSHVDFIHKCFKGGYNRIILKVAEFSLLFIIYQSIILLVERVKQDLIVFLSPDFNVFCQNIAVC